MSDDKVRASKRNDLRALYVKTHGEFWNALSDPELDNKKAQDLATECRKIKQALDEY